MDVVVLLGVLFMLGTVCYAVGYYNGARGEPMRDWVETRLAHRRNRGLPDARPIETVVVEVRRLGARYHGLHPHTSYAKVEAVRTAYDRALAECCAALGLTHLLGVLPTGKEQDAERERVEVLLEGAGINLPYLI